MNLNKFIDTVLNEEDTSEIKVEHPDILELPEGGFMKSGVEHYKKLVEKKGQAPVMRALLNLERWNKEKNPEIASHARKIIDAIKE